MSTPRPFFDLATPDYFRSLPPRSLSAAAPRASSLPRFVVGSAPAVGIDLQRQRASTPSASPASAEPPSLINVATPAPTPTSSSEASTRRSASPSPSTSLIGLPPLNLDATAPSFDSDSSSTVTVSQQRPARTVSFASTAKPSSTRGQPSLFSDIKQRRTMSIAEQSSASNISRDRTPTRMSSDASFAPPPFKGLPSEDAERWLRRFRYYVEYRKLSDDEALQLFKLLLSDTAADWLESLDDAEKRSMHSLAKSFIERFETSEIYRWKQASAIFTRQQGPNETVDIFITDVLNLAKRVPIDDQKIIRFALLKGFKPAIRQHVLQSSADTLDATVKAARIAEAAAAHGPPEATDITGLAKDVRDLLAAVADLKTKPRTPSTERLAYTDAGATSSTSRSNSPRRVSFSDRPSRPEFRPQQQSSSAYRRPVVNTPMSWEWPDDEPRYDRDRRPTPPPFQRRPSGPPSTWRRSRPASSWTSSQPRSPSSTFSTNRNSTGQSQRYSSNVCPNCGRQHGPNACFARGLQCFQCGRLNHFRVMCRSAPAQFGQPKRNAPPNFSGNFSGPNFTQRRQSNYQH